MMLEQVGRLYTQQIVARNLKEKQKRKTKTKTKTNITLRKITKKTTTRRTKNMPIIKKEFVSKNK